MLAVFTKPNVLLIPLATFVENKKKLPSIFLGGKHWTYFRNTYPNLLRLYHLTGSLWPACLLHCGWIEYNVEYGFNILDIQPPLALDSFAYQVHHMICI